MPVYYVVGAHKAFADMPWVLTPEGGSWSDAERTIRRQGAGQGDEYEWAIASWDGETSEFVLHTQGLRKLPEARRVRPTKGPYTEEAFQRFLTSFR